MNVEWIRDGLRNPKKTQSGLAKALGLAPPAVPRILRGERHIKADEVAVIARYLEVEPPQGGGLESLDLPTDNMEAALVVTEYVLQRAERQLDPQEKLRLVGEFRASIAKARHG